MSHNLPFWKSTPKLYDILKSAIIKRSLDGRSIKGEMSYYETRQYYENWYWKPPDYFIQKYKLLKDTMNQFCDKTNSVGIFGKKKYWHMYVFFISNKNCWIAIIFSKKVFSCYIILGLNKDLVVRSTIMYCTPLFFIFLAYDITGSHQELRGLGSHHIADSSYRINSSQVSG